AAILTRMLGTHIDVAVAWQRASFGGWMTYAAEVSRRRSEDGRADAADEVETRQIRGTADDASPALEEARVLGHWHGTASRAACPIPCRSRMGTPPPRGPETSPGPQDDPG